MNATKLVNNHANIKGATKKQVLLNLAALYDNGGRDFVSVNVIALSIGKSSSNTRKIMSYLHDKSLVVSATDKPMKNGPWKLNTKYLAAVKRGLVSG